MTVSEGDPHVNQPGSVVGLDGVGTADFVRIYTRRSPDSLVAAGLLARFCTDEGIPFHVRPLDSGAPVPTVVDPDDDTIEVAISCRDSTPEEPICLLVHDFLSDLGASLDPLYTLAGIDAADYDPETIAPELLADTGCAQEPGIGIPTSDIVTGLASSTLQHTEYSGDVDATQQALDAFGIPDPAKATPKELASFAAVTSVTSARSTHQSAQGLTRFLHPHFIEHPYQSIEGYGDIIRVLSHPTPGHVISLALPTPEYDLIRSRWQTYATEAHDAVRTATPTATNNYYRANINTEFPFTPARLLSYHTTQPTVITATPTHIALYTRDPPIPPGFTTAVETVSGSVVSTHNTAIAVLSDGTRDDFFVALDEAY